MAGRSYEPLAAQDASFLAFEGADTPMHVGVVALLEEEPLRGSHGGVDIDRLRRHVEARLHSVPRYRQRLASTPFDGRPIWVDEPRFDIRYHVRRTSLPRPGGDAELKELAGRLFSQHLDRHKPLWELWIVEGLAGGRCAMILKAHHCMVDGLAGVALLSALLSAAPCDAPEPAPPFVPRALPRPVELALDDGVRRLVAPWSVLRGAVAAALEPRETAEDALRTGRAILESVQAGFRRVRPTPLNRPIGPHRRIEWSSIGLDEIRDVRKRLGGTVNDVVLAVVAGAVRSFLQQRRFDPRGLDYRVVVPVNMRGTEAAEASGNRVSAWFLSLPLDARTPLERLRRVQAETERLKGSRAAHGTDLLIRFADWSGSPRLVELGTRFTARLRPYHLIVSNVPGPPIPLHLLGARLESVYPQLPLFEHQGLAVAAMSYCGRVNFGLVADADLVPDLPWIGAALGDSFRELHRTAEQAAP